MARYQKNTIGFYPKLTDINDDISISILSKNSIKVNTTIGAIIDIYYEDTLLISSSNNIIIFPQNILDVILDKEITIVVTRTTFNYTSVSKPIKINLYKISCCSEEDFVTITCSNTIACV